MTFDDYVKEGRARYAGLVKAIRTILGAAIEPHGLVAHAITGRAKAPGSLHRKLEKEGIDPAGDIAEALKDLAGVRIVFLTNGQVDLFGNAGVLHESFEVLNVNVHHPVPGTETEDQLFDSTNYLVELKADRLALPEYAPFAGMRCEIQVQTLLNHAWAEMNHDTFYKRPEIGRLGSKAWNAVQQRMNAVMRKHLLPAGHDFDKIAGDIGRLLQADRGFDETFGTLAASEDNQALHEAIANVSELILPLVDEPASLFLEHLPLFIEVVERTRGTPKGLIETPYGAYPGKSGEDIALAISRLIHRFRYADPRGTFEALVRLYGGCALDSERKIWTELAGQFSANDLNVWKHHGPAVPRLVLACVARLDESTIAAARGVLVAMLANVLSGDLRGMTSTSEAVIMHQGTIAASQEVAQLRDQAIDVLEGLLDGAPDDEARRLVLDGLRKGSQHPYNGASNELAVLIRKNAARILGIEAARVERWGLELRRNCENNALRCHDRFATLPPFLADDPEAQAARDGVIAALDALRDALGRDPDFLLYKTLVGHNSVRPDAWDGNSFDPEATQAWRRSAYPAIVATITAETVGEWIARTRSFIAQARIGTGDGSLWPMSDCFKVLAKTKPAAAIAFLEAMDEDMVVLLRSLLLGLDEAGAHQAVRHFVARWQDEGRFLVAIGDYLRAQDPFAVGMLEAVAARAIELGDEQGVLGAMGTAVIRHDQAPSPRLIDHVFMPVLGFLAEHGLHQWPRRVWGGREGTLIAALDEAQSQCLLDSFVGAADIGYEEDWILASVAKRFPELVLGFFEARILRDRAGRAGAFSPIPYEMYKLRSALAAHPRLLIAATRRWFALAPSLHEFYGGQLFHNVYPELPDEVRALLGEALRGGDRTDVEAILGLLTGYDGGEPIYPLCLDMVDVLEEGDPLLGNITRVLGRKGVLSGEFGFVEAEATQRARLEPYRGDQRPKVRAFLEDLHRGIGQRMAWEQRSAERRVEARKRQFGEE